MDDTQLIVAHMQARRSQLLRIADMAFNPEIKEAVLKVALDIEADPERLDAAALSNVIELKTRSSQHG